MSEIPDTYVKNWTNKGKEMLVIIVDFSAAILCNQFKERVCICHNNPLSHTIFKVVCRN